MTEREYVEVMRKAAADYVEDISSGGGDRADFAKRWKRWLVIRENMSAHTFISICDAWLEKDEASNGS